MLRFPLRAHLAIEAGQGRGLGAESGQERLDDLQIAGAQLKDRD